MLRILTDDGSDLSLAMRETYGIEVLPIGLTDGDEEFRIQSDEEIDAFYDKMRSGIVFATSRVTSPTIESTFKKYLEAGDEVLYITLSSGLSATYEGAEMIKESLEKDYPNRVRVVDGKTASFGEGLLAVKAAILRDRGENLDAIADYIEKIKTEGFEFFTVGNLEYLHRGGRVSRASKVTSGMLQVFPILHVDKSDGLLKVIDVHRGEKSLLKKLKRYMNEKSKDGVFNPNQTVFVYTGDWPERLEVIRNFLIDEMGVKPENIDTRPRLAGIIGAHTGPEVVVVTFSGDPDDLAYVDLENRKGE